MWRKDRFEEDVRKIGIKKVKMDLFNSPTTGKLNQYYGPDANPNPKLDRIETFCRCSLRLQASQKENCSISVKS